MAAGHALRGVASAWLGLIVLQTVTTSGSGRVAALFTDLSGLISRAMDPAVPAIPDRRSGAPSASGGATTNPTSVYRPPADLTTGLAPLGTQPVPPRNVR